MTDNIVDLYHEDQITSFAAIKAGGIDAVIHKATQGLGYTDPYHDLRRKHTELAGVLWGSYHFGTGDDPVAQAKHFMKVVTSPKGIVLALDLERNSSGLSMSLLQAEQFVTCIYTDTGSWPVLYTSSGYLSSIMHSGGVSPTLSNCPLWLAAYTMKATTPHLWSTWTMWQYTDGKVGPKPWTAAGVRGPVDRSQFNGTIEDMRKFWGR